MGAKTSGGRTCRTKEKIVVGGEEHVRRGVNNLKEALRAEKGGEHRKIT